jgi:hypothetical protein
MTFVEHVHCSRCGTRCSGVDPELGLVVRAWVECPECLAVQTEAATGATAGRLFSELDRVAVDPARAAIFVAEFFVWWEQAGRNYYGRGNRYGNDEGLQLFARDSVEVLGGWQAARRTLRSQGVPASAACVDRTGDAAVERGTSQTSQTSPKV